MISLGDERCFQNFFDERTGSSRALHVSALKLRIKSKRINSHRGAVDGVLRFRVRI